MKEKFNMDKVFVESLELSVETTETLHFLWTLKEYQKKHDDLFFGKIIISNAMMYFQQKLLENTNSNPNL